MTFYILWNTKKERDVWLYDLLTCSRFGRRGRCHGDRLCHGASGVKSTWAKLSWHQQRRVTWPQIPHPHIYNKQTTRPVMNSRSQNTHTLSSLASLNNRTTHGISARPVIKFNTFFSLIFCFLFLFQNFPSYPLIAHKSKS